MVNEFTKKFSNNITPSIQIGTTATISELSTRGKYGTVFTAN